MHSSTSQRAHNLDAMTKPAGRKRNANNIDDFNIDPTTLVHERRIPTGTVKGNKKAPVTQDTAGIDDDFDIDPTIPNHEKRILPTGTGKGTRPPFLQGTGGKANQLPPPRHERVMEAPPNPPGPRYNNGNAGVPHLIDLQSTNGGAAVVTQTMVSNNEDMTLSVSTRGLQLIVRDLVKEKLFRRLKFFDKSKHGSYSTRTSTVCGMLIKYGNISSVAADHKWWDKMRSPVMRTHTDHRNNCIKAMRLRFRGKYKWKWNVMCYIVQLTQYLHVSAECLIPNRSAEDAYHKTLNGGFNVPYMLEMRKNMVHYVQLIDAYAPCVVSSRAWNNEANMAAYCGSNDRLFERHVLSISDEAFMLVVLVNYSTRWQAEYEHDIKKVSAKDDICDKCTKQITPNR